MATRTTTELEQLLDRLEKEENPPDASQLERISEGIARLFHVRFDEVAVLALQPSRKSLRFLLPAKLQVVGTIPLTSTTALAARTARDRRADVVNNFANARHATVFEGIPLGRGEAVSIQKIMSVPILQGDSVAGVVQISRKGSSPGEAGPDFTSRELSELQGLNHLLGRVVKLCQMAPAAKAIDTP